MSYKSTVARMRPASHFEHRCIVRHALGYYGNLIVGGLYYLHDSAVQADRALFLSALKYAIERHPILSVSIEDTLSEAPVFVRPYTLNLANHLYMLEPASKPEDASNSEQSDVLIKAFINRLNKMSAAYEDEVPAWKVAVMPILISGSKEQAFWIGFSYSHSHGDGKSGLIFHQTFLEGLKVAHPNSASDVGDPELIETSDLLPLPPSLEEAADLRISWSFLLAPVLSVYLPTWIWTLLGQSPPGLSRAPTAWKGANYMEKTESQTAGIEICTLDKIALTHLLRACRSKGAKLTGLLHQAIAYGLHSALESRRNTSHSGNASHHETTTFSVSTAMDMRKCVSAISDKDMVNCVSGIFDPVEAPRSFNHTKDAIPEEVWNAARATGVRLAERSSTLSDQPIALLRYLWNMKKWMTDHIGKERERSFEVSNLGSFAPGEKVGVADQVRGFNWTVEQMVFSQPGNVTGSAIDFNVVSVQGGGLTITASWQRDVLGVDDEDRFVQQVMGLLEGFLKTAS